MPMPLGSNDFYGSTMFRTTRIRNGAVRKNVKPEQNNEEECSTLVASLANQGFVPTSIAVI